MVCTVGAYHVTLTAAVWGPTGVQNVTFSQVNSILGQTKWSCDLNIRYSIPNPGSTNRLLLSFHAGLFEIVLLASGNTSGLLCAVLKLGSAIYIHWLKFC